MFAHACICSDEALSLTACLGSIRPSRYRQNFYLDAVRRTMKRQSIIILSPIRLFRLKDGVYAALEASSWNTIDLLPVRASESVKNNQPLEVRRDEQKADRHTQEDGDVLMPCCSFRLSPYQREAKPRCSQTNVKLCKCCSLARCSR